MLVLLWKQGHGARVCRKKMKAEAVDIAHNDVNDGQQSLLMALTVPADESITPREASVHVGARVHLNEERAAIVQLGKSEYKPDTSLLNVWYLDMGA